VVTVSAVNLPYPFGLPVGDGWLPTCGSAEVDRALLTLRLAAEEAIRVRGEKVPLDLLDHAATKTFAADVGPVDALVFTPATNVRKHALTTGTRNSTAW
jgi:hypothetical protein